EMILLSLLVHLIIYSFVFFFNDPSTPEIYTLSLHDALPILSLLISIPSLPTVMSALPITCCSKFPMKPGFSAGPRFFLGNLLQRSEEHTSELQSRGHLVCRLLLEKKKKWQMYSAV